MKKVARKDMYVVNWTPFTKKKGAIKKTQVETSDLVAMPPLCTIMSGNYDDKGQRPCTKLVNFTKKGIHVECWTEYKVGAKK